MRKLLATLGALLAIPTILLAYVTPAVPARVSVTPPAVISYPYLQYTSYLSWNNDTTVTAWLIYLNGVLTYSPTPANTQLNGSTRVYQMTNLPQVGTIVITVAAQSGTAPISAQCPPLTISTQALPFPIKGTMASSSVSGTGAIAGCGGFVDVSCTGYQTVTFQITGVWAGTLDFYGSPDGGMNLAGPLQGIALNGSNGSPGINGGEIVDSVSNTGSAGVYVVRVPTGGFQIAEVEAQTFLSGSAQVEWVLDNSTSVVSVNSMPGLTITADFDVNTLTAQVRKGAPTTTHFYTGTGVYNVTTTGYNIMYSMEIDPGSTSGAKIYALDGGVTKTVISGDTAGQYSWIRGKAFTSGTMTLNITGPSLWNGSVSIECDR